MCFCVCGAAEVLQELAKRHGVSPAAVVLRWLKQRGIIAIPKSHAADRVAQNLQESVGWALSEAELARIDGLDEGLHCNGDNPATML